MNLVRRGYEVLFAFPPGTTKVRLKGLENETLVSLNGVPVLMVSGTTGEVCALLAAQLHSEAKH